MATCNKTLLFLTAICIVLWVGGVQPRRLDSSEKIGRTARQAEASIPCKTESGEDGICDSLSKCPRNITGIMNIWSSTCSLGGFSVGICCPTDHKGSQGQIFKREKVFFNDVECGISDLDYADLYVSNSDEDEEYDSGKKMRIIGGKESEPGQWPWMALVLTVPSSACGGSLITDRHVLTAAHCVDTISVRRGSVFAILGETDLENVSLKRTDSSFKVIKAIRHPGYLREVVLSALLPTRSTTNDIALLKLERTVEFSPYIRPLCLPDGDIQKETFDGKKATVIGWGRIKNGDRSGPPPRNLHEVEVPIKKADECYHYNFFVVLPDHHHLFGFRREDRLVCAGGVPDNKLSYIGDSGGPLMVQMKERWVQIGVVSHSHITLGGRVLDDVYTRVSAYMDWISDNLYT